MAAFDEEAVFGPKPKKPVAHEIGQNLDDLSEPELAERIGLLKAEIERLERAIMSRRATRAAAVSSVGMCRPMPVPSALQASALTGALPGFLTRLVSTCLRAGWISFLENNTAARR